MGNERMYHVLIHQTPLDFGSLATLSPPRAENTPCVRCRGVANGIKAPVHCTQFYSAGKCWINLYIYSGCGIRNKQASGILKALLLRALPTSGQNGKPGAVVKGLSEQFYTVFISMCAACLEFSIPSLVIEGYYCHLENHRGLLSSRGSLCFILPYIIMGCQCVLSPQVPTVMPRTVCIPVCVLSEGIDFQRHAAETIYCTASQN